MNGVLLMAYGTPRDTSEVEAFYTDVRGGRPPTPELLEQLVSRYQAIGGRTPLLAITQQQADALQATLGPGWRVFVGMRHWHPYIREAVAEMATAGIQQAAAIALAPHYSDLSVGAYVRAVEEAQAGVGSAMDVRAVRSWHLQPDYLDALVERIREASAGWQPETVIFTAHSLPRRILGSGDPYVEQLQETSRALAERLALGHWTFAFQSAGQGGRGEPWLGPDILETLAALAGEGQRRVLAAPIGFISDHLEILYDLDVQASQRASSLGMELRRTRSLNADPRLIEGLAAVAQAAVR